MRAGLWSSSMSFSSPLVLLPLAGAGSSGGGAAWCGVPAAGPGPRAASRSFSLLRFGLGVFRDGVAEVL